MTIQKLPLQKLVIKQKGEKPTKLSTVFMPDMLPYLGIEAIEKDEIKQFADWYSTVHSTEQDIFVVRTGGRNGLVLKGKKGVVGSTLYCLSPLWIDRDFLYYFLKLNEFQSSGERDLMNTFWNISVPIVSLEKQKQIAKNINEALSVFEKQNKDAELKLIQSLKSLVNVTSEILENIQNLDDFKKAVLELAFSGHLVKTADKWTKLKLNELFTVQTGFTPSRDNLDNWDDGTIHWLKSGEINNNYIYSSEENISNFALKSYNIKTLPINTILVAMYGEGKTRGQIGLLKIEAFINQAIAALVNEEMVWETRIFIYYSLLSQYNSLREKSGGGVRNNLNLTIINNIEISLPSLTEQIKIVTLIESVFILAEKINQDYQTEKLKQKELQKAIISSFYENLFFDENIEDVLSEIEFARKQKEAEIIDLRKKQKQFREKLSTLPKMGIIDVLKSSDTPVFVNDLWGKSKYSGNIDAFYEALKQEHEKKTISWKLKEENSEIEVPQSLVSLNQTTL